MSNIFFPYGKGNNASHSSWQDLDLDNDRESEQDGRSPSKSMKLGCALAALVHHHAAKTDDMVATHVASGVQHVTSVISKLNSAIACLSSATASLNSLQKEMELLETTARKSAEKHEAACASLARDLPEAQGQSKINNALEFLRGLPYVSLLTWEAALTDYSFFDEPGY